MTIKNLIALSFFLLTVSMGDRIRVVGNSATGFPKMYYTEYDAAQVQKNSGTHRLVHPSGRLLLRGEILRESNQ